MRCYPGGPAGTLWRRAIGRIAVVAVALSLALGFGPGSPQTGTAQEVLPAAWEPLPGVSGFVLDVITPSGGALLALSTDGLYRSDDGGGSWREVSLTARTPNTQPLATVDPTNHDVIYARGTDGLSKST